jgi:hypothetical protein
MWAASCYVDLAALTSPQPNGSGEAEMKRHVLPFVVLAMVFAASLGAQGGDPNYKPKRINKMIELLEAGP